MMALAARAHTGLKFTNMKLDKKYLLGEEGQGMESPSTPSPSPAPTSPLPTSACASACWR